MSRASDRLARFVDALLRERRPPRFPAERDEGAALQAAAALKAARPGADLPSADFVAGLERRLGAELARGGTLPQTGGRLSRRAMLQVGGVSAAAVVAGILVDRAVLPPSRAAQPEPTGSSTLVPKSGRWIPVVSLAALGPGQAVRFSSGDVEGFVVNHDGAVQAMSAVCTHMGCILRINQPAGRLDCPCHGASFDLHGSPLNHGYLDALPRLASRVRGGSVEVQVPTQA